ncbi:MAG TPA: hypothetical protein VMT81_02080 [Candidatus Paceibacterota bacterium]|nr:hypothetical protein [Candidatus Paceibacterota bacterium]
MTLATAGGKLTILTSQAQQEANRHEGKPKLPVPPGGVVPKRKGEGLLQRWSCDPDPDSDGTLRCVLTLHLTDAIVATPEFFTLLTSSSDPSVLEPPGDVRFNPAAKEVVLYFKAKPSLDPSPEIVHVPVVVGVSMKEGDSLATTVWVPLIR